MKASLVASKEIGPEVNTEKIRYAYVHMLCEQNA